MADLSVSINGIDFLNPVMPAAGPNVKTAVLMTRAAQLGAGAIVSKTFSVKPASDPRPTMKKIRDGGLLNCETWLEDSYSNFIDELHKVKENNIPLIVSIGYSAEDVNFLGSLLEREIKPDAVEFSTHYTGHNVEPLVDVAESLRNSIKAPVWMKISPGFPDIEKLVLAAEPFVDAFVAVNSLGPALDFDPVKCRPALGSEWGQGWMSGPPLMPIALAVVHRLSMAVKKPIIGVGGITTGEDAVKFLMAGASAVQVCTAAIHEGPSVYGRIADEINTWLDANNYSEIKEIIGLYRKN